MSVRRVTAREKRLAESTKSFINAFVGLLVVSMGVGIITLGLLLRQSNDTISTLQVNINVLQQNITNLANILNGMNVTGLGFDPADPVFHGTDTTNTILGTTTLGPFANRGTAPYPNAQITVSAYDIAVGTTSAAKNFAYKAIVMGTSCLGNLLADGSITIGQEVTTGDGVTADSGRQSVNIQTKNGTNHGTQSVAIGSEHNVRGQFSIGVGWKNQMSGASDNVNAFGSNNNAGACQQSTMIGVNNSCTNAESILAFGNQHVVNGASTNSILIGFSSSIVSSSAGAFVFGVNSNVAGSPASAIVGSGSSTTDCNTSYSFGNGNQLLTTNSAIVVGHTNVIDTSPSIEVFGAQNTITNATNTIVLGRSNSCGSTNDILVIGRLNAVTTASLQTIVVGFNNTATQTHNIVVGQSNTISSGTDDAIVIGRTNTFLAGTNGRMIMLGEGNTFTGGGQNDVQIIGSRNTVGNSGQNRITGSDNSVTAVTSSIVNGNSNTALNYNNAIHLGNSHTVNGLLKGVLIGDTCDVLQTNQNVIIGDSNVVRGSTSGVSYTNQRDVVIGPDNDLRNTNDTVIVGNNIIVGSASTTTATSNHTALGTAITISPDTTSSVAIGSTVSVTTSNSICVGPSTTCSLANSLVLGEGAQATLSIAAGGSPISIRAGSTTVGAADSPVRAVAPEVADHYLIILINGVHYQMHLSACPNLACTLLK